MVKYVVVCSYDPNHDDKNCYYFEDYKHYKECIDNLEEYQPYEGIEFGTYIPVAFVLKFIKDIYNDLLINEDLKQKLQVKTLADYFNKAIGTYEDMLIRWFSDYLRGHEYMFNKGGGNYDTKKNAET